MGCIFPESAVLHAGSFLPCSCKVLPEHVCGRLERALTIYRICSGHPDLQDNLMEGFDSAMGGTLQRLMTRSWPSGSRSLGAGAGELSAVHKI